MGQVIRLKRSLTASAVPAPSALVDGELALNLADRRLYAKDSGGNVFDLAGVLYAKLDSPALSGTPTSPTAAAGTATTQIASTAFVREAVDRALAGLDFQKDVLAVQTDATLDPGATPTAGDRYVITNAAALHANFGTISGVADNDIVEHDGSAFIVAYDVSAKGEGALAWDRAQNRWVRYDGATWDTFGGLAGVTGGVGIDVVGSDIILDLSELTDLGAAAEVDDYVAITDASAGEASRKVTVQNLVANVTLDGGTY